MPERIHPDIRVREWSPCRSSREGARPLLIVVHATVSHNRPGVVDIKSIGDFFSHISTQASSHVCTDNGGHSGEFVHGRDKAWHCAGYNRMSLGIEQVLPGDGTEITPDLYRETARWIAHFNKVYRTPIRPGRTRAVGGVGVVLRSGVVTHKSLGIVGGGHVDPGPNYDMKHLINLAKHYRKELH